jgi:hypothetical protein
VTQYTSDHPGTNTADKYLKLAEENINKFQRAESVMSNIGKAANGGGDYGYAQFAQFNL